MENGFLLNDQRNQKTNQTNWQCEASVMTQREKLLIQAGKHLAIKLAEVYRAANLKPAGCQAIINWTAIVTEIEKEGQ